MTAPPPVSRIVALRELLERFHEFRDPLQSRAGGGDGSPLPLMPETFRYVREVERLLTVMRDDRRLPLVECAGERVSVRRLGWHVRGWFVDAVRSPVAPGRPRVPRSRHRRLVAIPVDGFGRPLPVWRLTRVPGAREDLAECGVVWVAAHWGLEREPEVPRHGRMLFRLGCRCFECKNSMAKEAA